MCNISEGVVEKWFRKGYEAGIKNSIREGFETGIKDGLRQGFETGIKDGLRQGFETGKKRAAIRSIINVMKNMSLTFDQAVSALDIPENEREEYRKFVENSV